jgi:hypothetical protein
MAPTLQAILQQLSAIQEELKKGIHTSQDELK